MNCSRRALLVGAAGALAWPSSASAEAALDDMLARVARARAQIRTLTGPFVQTRTVALLATTVRSQGTLTLVRPDRLRWELGLPDDVTFWVGPEGLAYRSAHGHGRATATTAKMGHNLDDLRTLLGDDLGKLLDRWTLQVSAADAGGVEIDATPRDAKTASLQRIELRLDAGLALPTSVRLVEGPHDQSLIEFGHLVVDAPVEDSTMRPPP